MFAENEGQPGCNLLVLTLSEGKVNKYGKYTWSAFLRQRWPHLGLWKHPIFQRPDCFAYSSDLKVAFGRMSCIRAEQPSTPLSSSD